MALPLRRLDADVIISRASPVVVLAVVVGLLYWARVFFVTFFCAVAIAFILEPFVALLMRLRFPRSLASFVVCTVALLIVYLLGLGAYTQAVGLVDDYQENYGPKVATLVESTQTRISQMEDRLFKLMVPARQRQQMQQQQEQQSPARRRKKSETPPPVATPGPPAIQEVRIHEDRSPVREYLYSRLSSLYQTMLMASFVPFLVYFMLSWRDHIHRNFLLFFEGETRAVAAKSLEGIADMVRAFVVGNFALGLLLAATSSLLFWKLGLPYPLLIGPLSGFLSLVPYIGLPLALVPPVLVTITVFQAVPAVLLTAAAVTLLHILALNVLYPKLVGSRVHLNPLVVTVALMFWGFLWDAAGLILAIPLTAGLKAVCDNVRSLRSYGQFLGD